MIYLFGCIIYLFCYITYMFGCIIYLFGCIIYLFGFIFYLCCYITYLFGCIFYLFCYITYLFGCISTCLVVSGQLSAPSAQGSFPDRKQSSTPPFPVPVLIQPTTTSPYHIYKCKSSSFYIYFIQPTTTSPYHIYKC